MSLSREHQSTLVMKRMCLSVFLFLCISFGAALAQQKQMALVGGTLIDGFGGKPLQNSVILVEGNIITAVGQVGQLPIPEEAEIISTEGMSVMPGLWDMHVHLMINGHANYSYWDKSIHRYSSLSSCRHRRTNS